MEYRFLAVNELASYITIFLSVLTIFFGALLGSVLFNRLSRLFLGSLLITCISFVVLIYISNINVYDEKFDPTSMNSLRYQAVAVGALILSLAAVTLVHWRRGQKPPAR